MEWVLMYWQIWRIDPKGRNNNGINEAGLELS